MSIRSKAHFKILLTEFELIAVFSAIALLADTIWVFHDIFTNGMSAIYGVIAGGLLFALMGTLYIVYTHHTKFFKVYISEELRAKLKICKLKAKRG